MESLAKAFELFRSDALRLEGLPTYNVPEEAAALKAAAHGQTPDLTFLQEWLEEVSAGVRAGKRYRRIRLLSDPLTAYEQFEINFGYPLTAAAGEDIRYLGRASAQASTGDCWIFDGLVGFWMRYGEDGTFIRAEDMAKDDLPQMAERIEHLWASAPSSLS